MDRAQHYLNSIQVKEILIEKLGYKLPLNLLIKIVNEIESKTNLHAKTEVKRNKTNIIDWLTVNWKSAEPYIQAIKKQEVSYNKIQMERNNDRIIKAGVKIEEVKSILFLILGEKFNMKTLLNYAMKIAEETKLRLERIEKRNKNVLLTWFCKHWKKIEYIIERDIGMFERCQINKTINDFPTSSINAKDLETEEKTDQFFSPKNDLESLEINITEIFSNTNRFQTSELFNDSDFINKDGDQINANNLYDYMDDFSSNYKDLF